jgi:glucose/arabinose dehydrogenase
MKPYLMARILLTFVLSTLAYAGIKSATAKELVIWPEITVEELATGLAEPTHVTNAGDGSGRLFLVEQPGRIKIYQNGLLPDAFLDITDRVLSPNNGGGNEEGLLSVAFPPGYGATKDYFYVYYTRLDGNNQLSRFHLANDPNIADPESEKSILLLHHPDNSNHNGGQLAFGPDGYLYIGTGDGGGAFDPGDNAQDPASLLGKILRIDVEMDELAPIDGSHSAFLPMIFNVSDPSEALEYEIPPDNPFTTDSQARDEIWALGLRNPWRFSFDRLSGDLFIGDVGQSNWEEVDYQPSESGGGENYGWDIYEGNACLLDSGCSLEGFTFPIHTLSHQVDDAVAVTGGFVYRGSDYPNLNGIYFFSDLNSDVLLGLKYEAGSWQFHKFNQGQRWITSFGEDENGELYFVSRSGGGLYKITSTQQ